MIYPKNIKPGDTIGLTAPSEGIRNNIREKRVLNAVKQFTHRGYNILKTENVKISEKGRSSTKEERAKQFMRLVEDKNIDAIITLTGGEFLTEIWPYLDFEKIKENPKWIQGYSDITGIGFLATIIADICTMYSHTFASFGMEHWHEALEENLEILQGEEFAQESFDKYQNERFEEITGLEEYNLDTKVEWINARGEKEIDITGRMIGGCIDILTYIVGTKFDKVKEFIKKYEQDGFIWFFDNHGYTSESIVLALLHMKYAGWFEKANAVVFGRTTIRESIYDVTFEEAVMEAIGDLNIPVIFEADIGHKPPMITVLNGAIAEVKSSNGKGSILFIKK